MLTTLQENGVVNVKQFGAAGNGIDDDTQAIQATINAVQASPQGGGVFLPAGTYLISAPLIISADNIELVGSGWNAQILAAPTLAGSMVQVQGPGGAGNFRYGIRIAHLFFNGNSVAGVNGLDLISTYAALIDHVRMRFIPGISIHMDGISNAFGAYNYVRDCHISDGGTTAIGLQTDNSEWLTIHGCQFGFFSGGTAVAVKLQNLNNRIIGTSFDHNDIAVQSSFTHRNIIQGCQFDRAFTQFIYLQSSANNVISGNFFGVNSGTAVEAIRADGVNNDKNTIVGNTMQAASLFTNFATEYSGIGGTNTYAANDTGGLPIVLLTGIARGNHGYNPRGFSVAQPAVPASTVAATNTTGVDCTVHIAGGTLTAVTIGGSATGITAAAAAGSTHSVRVPAGQTIAITYTVAPTWKWFGD